MVRGMGRDNVSSVVDRYCAKRFLDWVEGMPRHRIWLATAYHKRAASSLRRTLEFWKRLDDQDLKR